MPGIEQFMEELAELGFLAERRGELVLVTLDVTPNGEGQGVQVATDPPTTYPLNPPHWLHVPSAYELPGGQGQASPLGSRWRKWSRKHPNWKGVTDARKWLAHARSLVLQGARP